MLNEIKLYFLYRRIKWRGWPKFKNFKEYKARRKWCLAKPEDFKKGIEYNYETP